MGKKKVDGNGDSKTVAKGQQTEKEKIMSEGQDTSINPQVEAEAQINATDEKFDEAQATDVNSEKGVATNPAETDENASSMEDENKKGSENAPSATEEKEADMALVRHAYDLAIEYEVKGIKKNRGKLGEEYIKVIFDGDISAIKSQNPRKGKSLSRLLNMPGFPFKKTVFYEIMDVAVQNRFLNKHSVDTDHLDWTSLKLLTKMPDGDGKIALIQQLKDKPLTTRELEVKIDPSKAKKGENKKGQNASNPVEPEELLDDMAKLLEETISDLVLPPLKDVPKLTKWEKEALRDKVDEVIGELQDKTEKCKSYRKLLEEKGTSRAPGKSNEPSEPGLDDEEYEEIRQFKERVYQKMKARLNQRKEKAA